MSTFGRCVIYIHYRHTIFMAVINLFGRMLQHDEQFDLFINGKEMSEGKLNRIV